MPKIDLKLWKQAEAEMIVTHLHRASPVARTNKVKRRCRIGYVRLKKVQA